MLRRFMIVCWVLFLIATGTTAVTFIVAEKYSAKAESIVATANEELEAKIAAEGQPENPYMWLPVVATPESELAQQKGQSFIQIALAGGLSAVFIFIWNIIWHAAHWVWMGRVVK